MRFSEQTCLEDMRKLQKGPNTKQIHLSFVGLNDQKKTHLWFGRRYASGG